VQEQRRTGVLKQTKLCCSSTPNKTQGMSLSCGMSEPWCSSGDVFHAVERGRAGASVVLSRLSSLKIDQSVSVESPSS
jgi:hypothetical protein